eukprot:CAMPEP_0114448440 /NCGR_PEP_ID=MMETSP0103-20121206/20325_1 /TAXON_ID=37642 ORGANISM="Paraphysomonas imperforata, Strain PA2" /NCGR_SAMPLE_ID=MMETSP0103 /ASSEMBLY_ACC=CAM_ASM_000201 /LENGTH=434 /DNA_ID=CAMNT_0001620453 /DNA_START=272 /DNA_END=1577 /DNA_ORIENTATION=+
MSDFIANRSDSSREMRESLMASEGHVADIRATVPLSRYKQHAYMLFRNAGQTSTEGYISRTYVAWKLFLTFLVKLMNEHPRYKVSDTSKKTSGLYEDTPPSDDEDFLLDEFDCPQENTQKPPAPTDTTGLTLPGSVDVSKLKILEQECNSQLGDGRAEGGSGLLDSPVTPPADVVPRPTRSALMGVKPLDREILQHLLGGRDTCLRLIPPPQRLLLHLRFSTPQGIKQIAFHRHDFYISFLRFFNPPGGWGPEQQQLKNTREAIETNRCFFIHLGIAINVHPFALQTYFRHIAASIAAKSDDDFQKEIVQSVLNYAGFVDANALVYIWPKEMQRCRICLISGDLKHPIFSCFFPSNVSNVDSLNDIIIHSDGSHFTLLKPAVAENSASFSVLSTLLQVARTAGCIIQEIPVDMNHTALGFPDSVAEVFHTATSS